MIELELHPAFTWTCDACGLDNWQRSVTRWLDPKNPEEREIIESMGGDLEGDEEEMKFSVRSIPKTVTCKHCENTFKAILP